MNRWGRRGEVACYVRKLFFAASATVVIANITINIIITFIDIVLPQSRVLYQPPNKPKFVKYLDNSLTGSSNCNISVLLPGRWL